jgi:plasmid maintenance system antidote protein VapI
MITAKNKEAAEKFLAAFVDRVKKEMKKQNISHNKMIETTGCSTNHFHRILDHTKLLTADKMVDIATALGYELTINFKRIR